MLKNSLNLNSFSDIFNIHNTRSPPPTLRLDVDTIPYNRLIKELGCKYQNN